MQPIRKIRQKPGHCGPSTIEMMYSLYGLTVSQDTVAVAIDDVQRITERGCSVEELAAAVEDLTPDYVLLAKQYATIDDIRLLTETYTLPVGVEWRGRFLEPDNRIWEEGHYTLVTRVNSQDATLEMIDPYAPGINLLSMNDRISIEVFLNRWWDTNPVPDENGVTVEVRDERLLFVLVPKAQIGMLGVTDLNPVLVSTTNQRR